MVLIITLPKHGWRAEHSVVTAEVRDSISIIIPTLGRKSLQRTLESIAEQNAAATVEVIVCADAAADFAGLQNLTAAKLVVSPGSGVNRVRNAGARQSRGAILWFLDDDTEVLRKDAFASLRATFGDSSVIAAGGEYVSARDSSFVEHGYNALCSVWRSSAGVENRELLLGGTLAVRRSAFEAAGGFDESIEYGGAETSFVQRLHARASVQERIVFDHRLDVVHRPAARSTVRWYQIAAAQSRQKHKTASNLPQFNQRISRAMWVVRRLDLRSILSLVLFGIPFIVASQIVALKRRLCR